jgi:hypothetical protein
MIFVLIVTALVVASLVALAKLLRGSVEHPANLSELLDCLEPVNIASFRHLACGDDDRYLKQNLATFEYLRLRWLRIQTIHAYYVSAFRNCSVLLSYGELLGGNQYPLFSDFGRELCSAAMQLRVALLRGIVGICFCYLAPLGVPLWREVTDRYNLVGSRLSYFCESNFPDLEPAVVDHFWL